MDRCEEERLIKVPVSRRKLIQAGATTGLMAAVGGLSLPFSFTSQAANKTAIVEDKAVWSSCTVNCGSRCLLRLHVKDDSVYWVESDTTGNDEYGNHQVRACLRGCSIRRRMNHPDRLKYPMKRVGKRGEGKFERISWDEALDTIADNLKRIIANYGNEAVHVIYATGVAGGNITKSSMPFRLMNSCGGFLGRYGTYSTAQITAGMNYLYGGRSGNSPDDIANTKLVVMFGNNPAETRMSGGGVTYYVEQARERSNARMIVIDPRYNDTAAGREDEWLPIRPGTDAALAAALAWVLITEDMVDKPFLDKYCVGYDEVTLPASAPKNGHYKAYILGDGPDGIAKTPEWAAQITGIPTDKIIKLAREIGQAKPAYICQGWGPQRQSNGEQTSRAIAMLAILTGNVGISGGNSGDREGTFDLGVEMFSPLKNPVKTEISSFTWTEAIERGTEMTSTRDGVRGKDKLDVPIKFMWCYASNTLINQNSNISRTHDILQDENKCEMIVCIDHFMTASAKYSDILLPDLMPTEQEDLIPHEEAGNMAYVILGQPSTSPKFERKPIYWTMSEIAKRLGPDVYQTFTEGRTQHEWVQYLCAKTKERHPDMPDYEEMKTAGIYKLKCPDEHVVAYKDFRKNPIANPLKTPSGKIEIYSERLANIAKTWELKPDEVIDPLPIYTPGFNGWEDPARREYPLQMTGFHFKGRVHSSYGNIDVLKQACRQEIWINPIDARDRGIKNGDTVRVFNQYGQTLIPAKVTPRIMPGVTAMGEGMWLNADMFGDKVDHGGSINILTTHRTSPLAKANPSHSNLVQVEKV
ncbi:TPA: DMSO/selenate family reductase complex A subunit [Salmonella enterica subsp. enterica serovar Ordonez]|uniref:Dimethyl sulfoxide reductase subunit A n=1 Tax=Salmonella ordonez TaxID=612 RepID=A0A5V6VNQ8_SALOR|nr:dimethyl sulfoxide reductase subunit A [Salmonella enterica]EBU8749091.1 dimethyl sulfoxide reductase subunit A [Salmonella enterica subsp. enterica serovar Ordonez]EGL6542210.1 molybdopterin-dependent oxidoreductase [Salmonella enterica subsp. enterica]EBX2004236.1 dimethyl sulfoxide reductase subunit A [Salmonella enterica subsp. enterica serovar Ordonez]EBY8091733.1 dimethyl sulfoxide reductase subunit A [Salmonella enterica subsp. enterica serovar Ordonez]